MKRILLGFFALMLAGGALAQTLLYPTLRGTYSDHQADIGYFGALRVARTDTLTATASGTLANSAVLGTGMNVIATVTTTNDSFTLPTLTGSVQVTVVNGGTNTVKIWPNISTGQIDTGGAGVGKTVAANKMAIFTQGADGLWYSVTSP